MSNALLHPAQAVHPSQPAINGRTVVIRELTADDRDQIVDLFEQLSDFDRYLRFFRTMPSYSSSVLDALTAMDGHSHVAVGAFVDGTCIGVIRYVRLSRRPTAAEVAVTVSSEFRGLGVARRLMAALTELAQDHGVEHFEIDVLPANRAAAALFRSLGFAMRFDSGSLVGSRPVRPEVDIPANHWVAA